WREPCRALSARTQPPMPISPCRLCGETKELRESHILPGFVYRSMKESSATGYLRFGQQPNLRVQDGIKLHLLCGDCEQRFSQWQPPFPTRIFPLITQAPPPPSSGSCLFLFCASFWWRVRLFHKDETPPTTIPAALLPSVERAELTWREFLLGSRPRP